MPGATGIDTSWLERKWLVDIKKRYKWISAITSWVAIWTLVVLIALLAYWRRKVRNRRVIKEWEEEELWLPFDEPITAEEEDSESETWPES